MDIFDKYKEDEEDIFDKYKIKKDLTVSEPTQFGIGAKAEMGVTLPEPTPTAGVSQRMRGIGEVPKEYPIEGITIELKEAQSNLSSLWWSELKTTEDKWKFLKHENWSPELQEADLQVQRLDEQASKMGVNTGDWIEYGVYATFFAAMAASVLPVVAGLPKNILNQLTYKVEGKTAKGQELVKILQRISYPKRYGEPNVFDKKIFEKWKVEGGIKSVAERMKGITIPEVTPRFAFGTKLYAGLPADEIAKSIVEVGKITADMVKGLDPAKVSQVTQQLLNTSPALASEFLKAVEKPEVPKEIEEKVEEPPPKEPWEPMVLPIPEVPEREYDFREPKIKAFYTPKKQLLREIGAEPILKDLIERKESLMVKTPKVNKWIGEVIKEINKKATFAEKLKAKTFNLPTEQVARFRDLLNAYEKSPDFLDPKTKEIFDKLRTFTKSMLNDANEMRVKAGLYPITDFGAYVPHFLDEISRAVRLDPEARKKVEHIVGKKLPKGGNPTALQRQIGAELDHIFSKDLGKLLTMMAKYDLRDIYLAEPYSVVRAELKQLVKDKAIPQSVLNEVENYIKFDVFDYQVPIDRIINTTLKPGTDIINLFLKPFNRAITNPIQNISSIYRQLLMGGAVAGKVRMLPRNLMQRMLNITLYPVTDSIRGQFSAPKEVVDKIRATNIYQLSVRKFEDVPTTFKAVQIGMAPYAKTHAGYTYFSNVDVSSRVGWNYGERMIAFTNTPKGQEYIKAYAKKHGIEEGSQKYKDLFWREGDQLEEAKEAIAKTQWEYYPTGMPRAYRGHMARAFWSLNSWWMNYFGQHAPEMFNRTRGTTGRGRVVRRIDRTNALKGLAIILGISAALKEKTGVDPSRFLVFPFPSYVYPHLFQIMLNTYYVFGAKNEKERTTYIKKLKANYKMLIPYSGAWKRYVQFLRGELTWKEWMFYVEQEARKSIAPPGEFEAPEDVFDKYGKETVSEDVFDKYKGE